MFLNLVKRRNNDLINVAVELHQKGIILPDTYVLDLDVITENARKMKNKANSSGIELFYMSKQFGRNPLIAKAIHEQGIEKSVVVDYKEALMMMEAGLPIGNIGHLVQIPIDLLGKIINYGAEYITVYSMEMLNKINKVALKLNKIQKIILKVVNDKADLYHGQYGGFFLNDIKACAYEMKQLSNIKIEGITAFPCFLYNENNNDFLPTNNIKTLEKAKELLHLENLEIRIINMPSATCCRTIPLIEQMGGNQGEPGHALTGTTPLHATSDLEELPGMVYLSEVSHNFDGKAYMYGGGYYRRGHLENAIIDNGNSRKTVKVENFENDSIDYYLELSEECDVGATVVTAFRTQIFVTRSDVAVVSGIQNGHPKLEGIYNSLGDKIRR